MRPSWFAILTLLTALSVPDAWAQQAQSGQPAQREAPRKAWEAPGDVLLSSTVIGARVKTREGKDLGEIDQLVIDRKTGQVSHAVVGVGGLAGVGETKVVVRWKDMRLTADPKLPRRTIASVDQAVVEQAPRWNRAEERGDRSPSASPPIIPPAPAIPVPRY